MAVKGPAAGAGVLLVTANVGSLFDDPENLQKNWLREFYQVVHAHKPHFMALHCQEFGGKNYEASMSHVDKFVKELLSSDAMKDYNRARVYLDENYKSQEHFTALGSFYFLHESLKNIYQFDFKAKKYKKVTGKEIYSDTLESTPMLEKEKFPQVRAGRGRAGAVGVDLVRGMSAAWRALRALRLRLLGPGKELVGTDQFGNKYFRVPQYESRAGQIIPERRFVEAVNRQAYQYEMGDFPIEWEAWIRKKRKDPPTIEEILRNENYREEMKQKIKDVAEKDKLLQAKEYKEGLVAEPVHTQIKGHASAPYYGKKEPSQDPTSTASTFQPGSWMPPGSESSHNK